jgi:hypothetical protein
MQESGLRLVQEKIEFVSKENLDLLPEGLRGIYVLYRALRKQTDSKKQKYEVLYVGMATAGSKRGIRGRLAAHRKSKRKGAQWTHFSAYKVWGNIPHDEIAELEGLFRHIYRKDPKANRLNIQRGFRKAREIPKIQLL